MSSFEMTPNRTVFTFRSGHNSNKTWLFSRTAAYGTGHLAICARRWIKKTKKWSGTVLIVGRITADIDILNENGEA